MELSFASVVLVSVLVFFVATLYSSVGHGGASGYLAVLALLAVPHHEMATTALILNIVVAGVAWVTFARAGRFSFALTWPFIVLSVPAAFMGGTIRVAAEVYSLLLAAALLLAAVRMVLSFTACKEDETNEPNRAVSIPTGAGIGLVSGIVGIGGGVFLSPVMILSRWASPRDAAATSAFFIIVNSLAALGGRLATGRFELGTMWLPVLAACAGGLVGSRLGVHRLSNVAMRRTLAAVLAIAAAKLVFVLI